MDEFDYYCSEMDGFDYYCSPDFKRYPDTYCAWCGNKDAKPLEGVDDIYLCETCRKDLEEFQNAPVV